MAGFPRYRLYASNGSTLIYDFEFTQDDQGVFFDPANFVEHVSLRGQGSIISEGSDQQPYDITLNFILIGDDYEDLVAQMINVRDTIDKFTKYILKVETTSGGSTENFNVMRLTPIQFPNSRTSKRVHIQDCVIVLRANCWS